MNFFAQYSTELMMLLPVIALAITALVFMLTKKRHVMIPTIEFYPPQKLNPAQLGYIIDMSIDEHDVIALLYYWAAHKHISLEQEDDGTITITRLENLDNNHSEYEKRFFSKLWTRSYLGLNSELNNRGNAIPESVNTGSLVKDFKYFAKEVYRKLRTEYVGQRRLTVRFRDTANIIFNFLAVAFAVLLPSVQLIADLGFFGCLHAMLASAYASVGLMFLLRIPVILVPMMFIPGIISYIASIPFISMYYVLLSYARYLNAPTYPMSGSFITPDPYYADELMLQFCDATGINEYTALLRSGEISLLPLLIPALAGLLFAFAKFFFLRACNSRRTEPSVYSKNTAIGLAAGTVAAIIYTLSFTGTSISLWIVALFSIITVLTLFLSPRVRNYTDYGAAVLPRCEGFRQFLLTAEKDRLEMLLDENPDYYYDVLPFAHALNVSNIWKEKFDHLDVNF